MEVNLISDTVTVPGREMLATMMKATVGDDVFKSDPTVNALESKTASMFGMESGLFCPSGTMTNQIAIKLGTNPLDEIICEENSHIHHYENAAYAMHSGVGLHLIKGRDGIMSPTQIEEAIRPGTDWYPRSGMVVVENTCNKAGGTLYTFSQMEAISKLCRANDLSIHLDGARIFNAVVEENMNPKEIGPLFDTVSVCLSKGLGAPVGSILMGREGEIAQARRLRKAFGGGMRQAGYLAAAGIYALDHQIGDLKTDHLHATLLKEALQKKSFVKSIRPGKTNIVIFDLTPDISAAGFIKLLDQKGIQCVAFGPQTVRLVTHRDISREMINYCIGIISEIEPGKQQY